MEILKIAWKYAEICWPYIFFAFAGMCYGIKLGRKWGKQDDESWLKLKFKNLIEFKLGQPLTFLNDATIKGSKNGARVQGVLDLDFPDSEASEFGLPFKFKFTPDKTQWQPGPCSDPSHWPKQQ